MGSSLEKTSGIFSKKFFLGIGIISLFLLNLGLYRINASLGPLPWGFYKQEAPKDVLFYVTDAVGKAPPSDAKTISEEVFTNPEGEFWNGLPDPDHLTNSEKDVTLSAFWDDYFNNPSYYGTPAGVASSIWNDPAKNAIVRGMGVNSYNDLLASFQDFNNLKKATDICLATGSVFYITSTEGSGASRFQKTVGVKPMSDFWDPYVTSAGIANMIMDGANSGGIIKMMRTQGYSDAYIRMAFDQILQAHGTSNPTAVDYEALKQSAPELWSKDKVNQYGNVVEAGKAPGYLTVRETPWMYVSQDMLNARNGKLTLPDGTVVTTPGIITFGTGLPSGLWFEAQKIPIGEIKGNRDFHCFLPRDYLDWLKTAAPDVWNKYLNLPSANSIAPVELITKFVEWNKNVANGAYNHVIQSIYSPLYPSKELEKIGINPSYYSPSITSCQMSLYMKGDSDLKMVFENTGIAKQIHDKSDPKSSTFGQKLTAEEEAWLKKVDTKVYVEMADKTLGVWELRNTEKGSQNIYAIEADLKFVKDLAAMTGDKAAYVRGVNAAIESYTQLQGRYSSFTDALNTQGLAARWTVDGTMITTTSGKYASAVETYTARIAGYEFNPATGKFEKTSRVSDLTTEKNKIFEGLSEEEIKDLLSKGSSIPAAPAWESGASYTWAYNPTTKQYEKEDLPSGITQGYKSGVYDTWVPTGGGGYTREEITTNVGAPWVPGEGWQPTPGTSPRGLSLLTSVLRFSLLNFSSLAKKTSSKTSLLSLLSVSGNWQVSSSYGVAIGASFGGYPAKLRNLDFTLRLLGKNYDLPSQFTISLLQSAGVIGSLNLGSFTVDNIWLVAFIVAAICLYRSVKIH